MCKMRECVGWVNLQDERMIEEMDYWMFLIREWVNV